jgi:hypothetical protein
MRIRTIKPEFWQSESMSRVSREARLLFVGLWSMADDSGKTRAASRMLASTLFPYDDEVPNLISGWLDELEKEKAIRRYEVDGSHYLIIPKWAEHQKIDKPSKSKLPDFVEGSRVLAESSRKIALDQGSGIRDQGKDQGPGKGPSLERRDEPAADGAQLALGVEPQAKPSRQRDPLFDALTSAEGSNPAQLTRTAARAIGVALAEIRRACPDLTADEINRRCANYRKLMPNVRVTASGLSKHWARCDEEPEAMNRGRRATFADES